MLSKNETLQGTYPNYTNAISLVKETDNSYRLAITEDEDGTTTKEFTTNETGAIHIEGLESGIYYLHEISAPEGYNELKAPVKIEITLQDGDYTKPIYVIDGKANTDQNNTVKVENKKGIEFPETGGIGTIGLTVLGVGVILLGVLAPRKKKKDQTPQE